MTATRHLPGARQIIQKGNVTGQRLSCRIDTEALLVTKAFTMAIIPFFTYLACGMAELIMWCRFRRQHSLGMDYNMLGDTVYKEVKSAVFAVTILNFGILIFVVSQAIVISLKISLIIHMNSFTMSLLCLLEVVGIIMTITNVRQDFVRCCHLWPCCKKPQSEPNIKYENNSGNLSYSKPN